MMTKMTIELSDDLYEAFFNLCGAHKPRLKMAPTIRIFIENMVEEKIDIKGDEIVKKIQYGGDKN